MSDSVPEPDIFIALPACDCPRPHDYPLPVHHSGWAYHDINMSLSKHIFGWREWQAKRAMAEIIPEIDRRIIEQ